MLHADPISFLHYFANLEVLPGLTATGRAEVMVDHACRWEIARIRLGDSEVVTATGRAEIIVDHACRWEIARIRLGDSEVDLATHGAAIWQDVHDAILDNDKHRRDIRIEASRVWRHEMARLEAAQRARDESDPFAKFEDQAA